MPRFFFDVLDGRKATYDDAGMEFAALEAARKEAQRTIGEIVKDSMPDGDEHVVVIRVREESGKTLLMVSTVMTVARVG